MKIYHTTVTGSTSGIGLGIAQSLAAEGADILLNGFGDFAEIADLRKSLAATHNVRVGYSNRKNCPVLDGLNW